MATFLFTVIVVAVPVYVIITAFIFLVYLDDYRRGKDSPSLYGEEGAKEAARKAYEAPLWPLKIIQTVREMSREAGR